MGNLSVTSKKKRQSEGASMKVEIPLTPEQEEMRLLDMIQAETLFMDITFKNYPTPLTSLDLIFRDAMNMESNVRKAIPADIPKIREFFDTLKLIEDGMVK